MKHTSVTFLLLFCCVSCQGQNYSSQILSNGVLLSHNSSVFWEESLLLLDLNGEDYAKIWTDERGVSVINYSDTTGVQKAITQSMKRYYPSAYEEFARYNNEPDISIRSFDDGFDSPLMVFDAKQTGETYQVFVNGEWRLINYAKPLVFKKWGDFISDIYVKLTQSSPLRLAKDDSSEIVEKYNQYHYEVVQVDGDWLKVRCWLDCEGCPDGQIVEGWVKWRDNQKLLVDLYYLC